VRTKPSPLELEPPASPLATALLLPIGRDPQHGALSGHCHQPCLPPLPFLFVTEGNVPPPCQSSQVQASCPRARQRRQRRGSCSCHPCRWCRTRRRCHTANADTAAVAGCVEVEVEVGVAVAPADDSRTGSAQTAAAPAQTAAAADRSIHTRRRRLEGTVAAACGSKDSAPAASGSTATLTKATPSRPPVLDSAMAAVISSCTGAGGRRCRSSWQTLLVCGWKGGAVRWVREHRAERRGDRLYVCVVCMLFFGRPNSRLPERYTLHT